MNYETYSEKGVTRGEAVRIPQSVVNGNRNADGLGDSDCN